MTEAIIIAQPGHAELVSLFEADLHETAGFIAAQSGRDPAKVHSHLQWFLLENPARNPLDPIGYGLRSAGQLAGCILLSPQFFRFDRQTILLMGSSSFYVEERYRGQGGRLFLQYCRLAKQLPLFGTSANAEAAALWKAAGARPIPYSDGELFGVLRWPPIAEEFAHRRYSNRILTGMAGTPFSSFARLFHPLKINADNSETLRPLTSAEHVNDLNLPASSKLTALRDPSYIRWRYYSGHDPTAAAFAFRAHQPARDVLVTVNRRQRGFRNQIEALNILDLYPEVSPEVWVKIVAALLATYGKAVDAVVLRGLNLDLRDFFVAKGFLPRSFEAPNGWFLDKVNLLPAHDWYAVPADGDGLI
jgi:hypothetical protein